MPTFQLTKAKSDNDIADHKRINVSLFSADYSAAAGPIRKQVFESATVPINKPSALRSEAPAVAMKQDQNARIRRRARRRGRRLGLKSASSVNFADRKVQASPGTLRQLQVAPKAPIDDIEWMF